MAGKLILDRAREELGDAFALPIVDAGVWGLFADPTVADIGRMMFGGVDSLDDTPVDLAIIGAGPPSTGRARGSRPSCSRPTPSASRPAAAR